MMGTRTLLAAGLLVLLAACGSRYPAGGGLAPGAGGTGGAGPTGGAGGTEPEPPPLPIALPGFTVEARTQLWAPAYGIDGAFPVSHTLFFLEAADACDVPGGLELGPGEAVVAVTLLAADLGACPIDADGWGEPPPPGCRASVFAAKVGTRHWVRQGAMGGVVHVDELAGGRIRGEVRALVADLPPHASSCEWSGSSSGDWQGSCACADESRSWSCTTRNSDDVDCCDDGAPLVEVVFSFDAVACDAAATCHTSPCAAQAAAGCTLPDTVTRPDCATACAGWASVCEGCWPVQDGWCVEDVRLCGADPCELDRCLERCEALGGDPLVALTLGCLESAGTCARWESCVSECGAR